MSRLIPMSNTFSQTARIIKIAMTTPTLQIAYERSFSKMKIIKSYLRNYMNVRRLSDLIILAVERNFYINYVRVIDKVLDNHKNSRILLRQVVFSDFMKKVTNFSVHKCGCFITCTN